MKRTYVAGALSLMLSLLLIFSASCGEPEPMCPYDPAVPFEIDPSLAEDYEFQPGSYWVYWDSAAQQEDSLAVEALVYDSLLPRSTGTVCGIVQTASRVYSISSTLDPGLTYSSITADAFHHRAFEIPTEYGSKPFFRRNSNDHSVLANGITVQGQFYPEVEYFRTNHQAYQPDTFYKWMHVWMAPEVGVIRATWLEADETTVITVRELLRHSVN